MDDSTEQIHQPQVSEIHTRRRSRRRSHGPAEEWETVHVCKKCVGGTLSRVHRETFLEFVLSCFGSFPFICNNCHRRSNRLKMRLFLGAVTACGIALSFLAVAVFLLHGEYVAQAKERKEAELSRQQRARSGDSNFPKVVLQRNVDPAEEPQPALTNQDVVMMVKGGMSSTLVINLINRMDNKFVMDSKTLVELEKAHVPQNVILAMVGVAKGAPDKDRAVATTSIPLN